MLSEKITNKYKKKLLLMGVPKQEVDLICENLFQLAVIAVDSLEKSSISNVRVIDSYKQ